MTLKPSESRVAAKHSRRWGERHSALYRDHLQERVRDNQAVTIASTAWAILLVRRQLANMAARIGQRLAGSILARLVSVVAGGIGLVLIAKDIWELRNGVLPIIAASRSGPPLRLILIIKSVPMLPDPMIATGKSWDLTTFLLVDY